MDGVKLTPSELEVSVTRPPPYVLNITAPLVVATGVAEFGVVGATRMVVGAGTVDAWMALLNTELTEAALELDSDAELACAELCAGVLGVGVGVVLEVVALELLCLLAIWTSLEAMKGFSEWTCSMAERSLLKTPSLNLGASECRAWCMASLSMESRSALNSSQSIAAALLFRVCWLAGDEKTQRKRVPSTRAFRRPNMVEVCGEAG